MPKSGFNKKQRTMPEFARKATPGGTSRKIQDGGSGKTSLGGTRSGRRDSVAESVPPCGSQNGSQVGAAPFGLLDEEEGWPAPCVERNGARDLAAGEPASCGTHGGAHGDAALCPAPDGALTGAQRGAAGCVAPCGTRQGGRDGSAGGSAPRGTPAGGQNGAVESVQHPEDAEGNVTSILIELRRMLTDVASAVDRLTVKVDNTCAQMASFGTRMQEVEERVSALEDTAGPTRNQILELEKKVRDLERRAEDAEGRSRRNNIRVIGLPEGHDPRGMEAHMEAVLRAALPSAQLSQFFLIERAHRVPGTRPPVGADPRTVICRIFNYRDRDALLAAARSVGEARYENVSLQFYPDYTLAVQQQRRQFGAAKRALRDKKLQYGMLYPSRLRVEHEGRAHFFTEPAAVFAFVESLGRRSPRSPPRGGGTPSRSSPTQVNTVTNGNEMQRLADTIGAWEVRHSPGAAPRRGSNVVVTQAMVHVTEA